MTPEDVLAHCLTKPGAWRDEPWDGDTVAKVGPRIFAFLGGGSVGVAAATAVTPCGCCRREDDASVMPYIGRSGWNTLRVGGAIDDDEIREAVDASYEAVVAKLARKDRPT